MLGLALLLVPVVPGNHALDPGPGNAPIPVVSVRLIDLNGDGAPDRLSRTVDGSLRVDLNVGSRNFASVAQQLPQAPAGDVLASDLDGDGLTDLYLVGPGSNVALLGDGEGRFREATAKLGLADRGNARSVERVDVDGDGFDDLVLQNADGDVLFWAEPEGWFTRSVPVANAAPVLEVDGTGNASQVPGLSWTDKVVTLAANTPANPTDPILDFLGKLNVNEFTNLLNNLYLNKNQEEVRASEVLDGSLTGADVSTLSGDVGVGTLAPGAKLDVIGNIAVGGTEVICASGQWTGSPTGLVGPTGPAGADGAAGPAGPTGPAGSDGATGPTGPMGLQGLAGNDGAPGPTGPAGAVGAAGATGPAGPTGTAGTNGMDGATGPAGPTGAAGTNGVDGGTGPAGPTGPQGPAGTGAHTGGFLNIYTDPNYIGGGQSNQASGSFSTVTAGGNNSAAGYFATVGGGYSNSAATASHLDTSSTVGGGNNNTASVLGGSSHSTVGGDSFNTASTSYDNSSPTVGGGAFNQAVDSAGYYYMTATSDRSSTVAGGFHNVAARGSAVGGGAYNYAAGGDAGYYIYEYGGGYPYYYTGFYGFDRQGGFATIGGGLQNRAIGYGSTVAGGIANEASGAYSFVAGGVYNNAVEAFTFAAGRSAIAEHKGSFVWGDATGRTRKSMGDNTFNVYACGGATFFTDLEADTGVKVTAGSGTWASLSDRDAKENVEPVDTARILELLSEISISTWNYKAQDDEFRHIGPMAQDFHAAFGLGESDKHIATIDPDGVALAAIQELYRQGQAKDSLIAELKAENSGQAAEIAELRQLEGEVAELRQLFEAFSR